MRCPHCEDVSLSMSERSGIEIDYCPKCRGVWLDRGELDKLIERAAGQQPQAAAPATPAAQPSYAPSQPPPQYAQTPPPYPRQGKPDDSHYGHPSPYAKRKKSWLSEIFD